MTSNEEPRTVWTVRGLLVLAALPAIALLTYPGWLALAVGFVPYFNLHLWLQHPVLLWAPIYGEDPVGVLTPPVPVVEMLAAGFMRLGFSPLAALRSVMIVALLLGTAGTFAWQRRRVNPWAALAAALTWLYSPPLIYMAYRLGHIAVLVMWAVLPWLVAGLQPRGTSWGRFSRRVGGVSLALAWLPLLVGPDVLRSTWGILLPLAFLGTMFVGWAVDRWRWKGVAPVMGVIALAAWLTVSRVPPHYVDYVPPPRPVALLAELSYGGNDLILLEVEREGTPRPGAPLDVVARWQPLRPVRPEWTVFVQVLDAHDHIWGQYDGPLGRAARLRAEDILVGSVVTERYSLTVDRNAPADLRVIMGVYDRETMRRMTTLEGEDHVTFP